MMTKRTLSAVLLLAVTVFGATAHAGVFDRFKSKDRLRRESMARGLSYHRASEAARLIKYSNSPGSSGTTSLQREALKNGASWNQAQKVR
jgi:hypothetical protein